MPLSTAQELASAVAGGIPFLIQPPIPPISLDEADLEHLGTLYRFAVSGPAPDATSRVAIAAMYYPATRELILRSWLEDVNGGLQVTPLLGTSAAEIYSDDGNLLAHATAAADPVASYFQALTFQVALALSHTYRIHVRSEWSGGSFERDFIFSVTR